MGLRKRRVLGALMLGTFLAAMPLVVGFHADGLGLAAPKAFAKDGKDDRGGDDRGGDRGGGDRGSHTTDRSPKTADPSPKTTSAATRAAEGTSSNFRV